MKPYLKNIAHWLGLTRSLEHVRYRLNKWKHRKKNRVFRQQHPGIVLPPAEFLYETYQTDYRRFWEDGKLAARELQEWLSPYMLTPARLLDWGCGIGRVVQHLPAVFPHTSLYGADVNAAMIEWDRSHYTGINFVLTEHYPPTPFPSQQFDCILALSVFTHIDPEAGRPWLEELHRILTDNGLAVLSTHGEYYLPKLTASAQRQWAMQGVTVQPHGRPGDRVYATYHEPLFFRKLLDDLFVVLACYNGMQHPEKLGGQDLWIIQKRQSD